MGFGAVIGGDRILPSQGTGQELPVKILSIFKGKTFL
jgi:hypothetical protein